MGKLIYSPIASLDGYVEDAQGKFDWAAPDEEVHAFVNDLERSIGTYLYGRRMYETMVFWETAGTQADEPSVFYDYAEIWRAAEKVVYSRTLQNVTTARTRLERAFDLDAVRRLKETASSDVSVGGAELAGHALAAGLVDELQLLLSPMIVGGGKAALPDAVAYGARAARRAPLHERRRLPALSRHGLTVAGGGHHPFGQQRAGASAARARRRARDDRDRGASRRSADVARARGVRARIPGAVRASRVTEPIDRTAAALRGRLWMTFGSPMSSRLVLRPAERAWRTGCPWDLHGAPRTPRTSSLSDRLDMLPSRLRSSRPRRCTRVSKLTRRGTTSRHRTVHSPVTSAVCGSTSRERAVRDADLRLGR